MMVDTDLRLMAWNQRFPDYTGVPNEILRVGLPMEDILRSQVAGGEFGEVDPEAEVARRMGNRAAYLTYQWNYGQTPRIRQSQPQEQPQQGGGFGGG